MLNEGVLIIGAHSYLRNICFMFNVFFLSIILLELKVRFL